MSDTETGGAPAGLTPVPGPLLEFQRTLRLPAHMAPHEFVATFDPFMNRNPPAVRRVEENILIAEVNGWRVQCDIFVPPGTGTYPVLLYFHGGAWVMGNPKTHVELTAQLCRKGFVVVSVDYRRAPKHRFPAAVEDALTALAWVSKMDCPEADTSQIFVAGDSAGANIAAVAAAHAQTEAPPVRAAVLFYGIYNYQRALPVLAELVGGSSPEEQLYVPPASFDESRDDARLNPELVAGSFAPSLIVVGEDDPLLPESLALAAALDRAGVPHDLRVIPGAAHGFMQVPGWHVREPVLDAVADWCRV